MTRRFSSLKIALRLLAHPSRSLSALGCFQIDTRAARLGKSNGNRLLRRTGAMFTLSNMVHFLAHKFARLRAGRLAFFRILMRSVNDFVFRHLNLLKFCLGEFWIDVHVQTLPVSVCLSHIRHTCRFLSRAWKLNAKYRVV
jgi:hypothetical protein